MKRQDNSPSGYYGNATVVAHYSRAICSVGLWESERRLVEAHLSRTARILDLGCGTGRVALNLWPLGYACVRGLDLSPELIAEARDAAEWLRRPVPFEVGDATALPHPDASVDGVIFAFNGLMQIPGAVRRAQALREIARVLVPGGVLLFSTHDRDLGSTAAEWMARRTDWDAGRRNPGEEEFGDRVEETPAGRHYIHIPSRDEVVALLAANGLELVEDHWRPALANESAAVREFSDDCRLWVARKPASVNR